MLYEKKFLELRNYMIKKIFDLKLKNIRVNQSGCLDKCESGPVMVIYAMPILPYALAFAAGAMIFIVIEEVVPESQRGGNTDIASLGLIGGFIIMMCLDVALG